MLDFVNKWKHKVAHYIDVRMQLMKLNIIERVSGVLSYFIFAFIALFLLLAILIFLGIGLAEYFSELVNSRPGGYFMTTGVYALVMVILVMARTSITGKFSGIFIAMLTAGDDDDKDEKEEDKPAL